MKSSMSVPANTVLCRVRLPQLYYASGNNVMVMPLPSDVGAAAAAAAATVFNAGAALVGYIALDLHPNRRYLYWTGEL
jgi:hypothetical protein